MTLHQNAPRAPLTESAAWQALRVHHGAIGDAHLRQIFAEDPLRGTRLRSSCSKRLSGCRFPWTRVEDQQV